MTTTSSTSTEFRENTAQTDAAPGTAAAGSKLRDRVAFVTGGTRGIGAAICRSLASQGAAVAAGYSGNDEAAERFRTAFCSDFPDQGFSVHKGDISDADDCRRTIQEVIDQHGRLDILVNNAGITADRTVLKMTDDDWRRVIDVNLSGAFYLSQAALRHMLERGTGRIINISSVIGEMGNIGQSNYASAKSGLFGLTKTLAREACFQLQRSGKLGEGIGLTVNTVTPGYIATEMVEAVPEKVLEKITAQIPMGRLGRPEEVARIVHFLAADASGYVTGQVWGVNGGLDM
ncbi:beta-ketoacyl-ACP reductase [Geodermatophilus marinus]|uniref:beta-ketoacyl-ACP reductase n=1 Tax=Geodermatophilus sp. LHW52908 TaxID=2303986 RepID=UPI000E3C443F|nr:beta-ketoacyl-ACP reductase [Geodermatophilus sp. LHW52908]RFU21983.1 beta-ketoacyl-ACP reductase [Geodermatophilus sp. LHW52908]